MPDKPHVFVSHSAKDADIARHLKTKIIEASRKAVEVFVSEDPANIPPGADWLPQIRKALDDADFMIVLMTTHAARSSWVSFEAGYAIASGKDVVPVLVPGYSRGRLRPPLAMRQFIAIEQPEDVSAISSALSDRFDLVIPAFTSADAYDVFGLGAFVPRDDPSIDVTAMPRPEMYAEIMSLIRRAKPQIHIRATSTIALSRNDEEAVFLDYMEVVAAKIAEAKRRGYAADYTLVTAFTPEPDGRLPAAREAAVRTRLDLFEKHGARDRYKLYHTPYHWSVDVLVIGDDHVVIGFPAAAATDDPLLRNAIIISGHEFVTHIVHWFDHCVRANANRVDLNTMTVLREPVASIGA